MSDADAKHCDIHEDWKRIKQERDDALALLEDCYDALFGLCGRNKESLARIERRMIEMLPSNGARVTGHSLHEETNDG